MQTSSIVRGVYESFYSKSFYRKVARQWDGEPFLYLLLLLALSGVVFAVLFGVGYSRVIKPMWHDLLRQIPNIRIVNSRAVAEGPQPLTIKTRIGDKEMVMAVIDTGDHFKSIEESGAPILLNSHELVVLNRGEKRIRSLSQMKDTIIDRAWLQGKLRLVMKIVFAVTIPILLVVVYGYQLLKALIYSLVGLLWNGFFGTELSFAAIWRLSLVAMTPAWVLGGILHFKRWAHIPFYVYILLTLSYLGFAVWANLLEESAGGA